MNEVEIKNIEDTIKLALSEGAVEEAEILQYELDQLLNSYS